MSAPSYVIITPARNEGQYLQKTIDSVVAQTLRPRRWVIVEDGSTDNTAQLVDAAVKQHSWIRAVHRADRGFRKPASGVMEAFYDGYKLIEPESWEYLVKLDGDLSFSSDYFERCLGRFVTDPKLGIGGGKIYCLVGDETLEDSAGDPPFHVRGATKIYRRATWEAIGGLIQAPGWDTLDEVKANMLGWTTGTFGELRLVQHRQTGAADGVWKNWFKNGRANYVVGYHPLFMLAKCCKRMFQKPYGIASLALGSGFASGYLRAVPRVEDRSVVDYLRRQQVQRLLLRKSLWSDDRHPLATPGAPNMAER